MSPAAACCRCTLLLMAVPVPLHKRSASCPRPAVSALYYLLTAFGRTMLEQQPAAATAAVLAAGHALLAALQGQALVREALASASVALYAAAALPAAAPAAMAHCFAQGLLSDAPQLLLTAHAATGAAAAGGAPPSPGMLDEHLQQRGGSGSGAGLAAELQRLAPVNRICALRGLLAAVPASVACAPLVVAEGGQGRPWLLLVDGALPEISAAIQVCLPALCLRGHAPTGVLCCRWFCTRHLRSARLACRAPRTSTSGSTPLPHWQSAWSGCATSSSLLQQAAALPATRRCRCWARGGSSSCWR